ncbi:MAG: hypothetical protein MRY64_12840, partial [Hyphomonadaceae bacterium]|nr:hypothetical protein [Hyphomonadaceae bacterium]
ISGEMMVNGEIVSGRWRALAAMLPIVLIFPVVIFLHAVMFSAFLTFGLWVYRLRKPIIVVEQLVDDAIE